MQQSQQQSDLSLALDFGGTKLAAGLVNWRTGKVERQARCATSADIDARGQIADMVRLVEGELGLSTREVRGFAGLGVSYGGPVDADKGIVLQSHHIPGWENMPLAGVLQEHFGCPARVENDANAVALGEYRYGAGRGVQDLVYMTVSTGIGGGVVLEGKLWRGHHGVSGEVGHTIVRPDGPECTCGRFGCLEALASGQSIARRAREALKLGDAARLLALADGDPDKITAEMVFRAARAGDPVAAAVVQGVAIDLGLGISVFCSIVDPARVIIGGGVAKAGEQLFAPVRQAFQRYAYPITADKVDIVPAAALDEGGLLGAAALVAESVC